MANRFPLVAVPGQVNTIGELVSGDNLDLTASNIVVDTDKVLTLPQITTTLVGRNTSDSLSNKVLVAPKFADTTGDHYYQIAVNELDGTRTLSLPLLTGNDEFVFKDHTQTLTNKTLTDPTINAAGGTLVLPQGATASQTAEGSIFWDTDDNILTIGTASGRKTIVDTDSTQSLSGKTIDNLTITGTLTAGGSVGTTGKVLKSTGTGVQWADEQESLFTTESVFIPKYNAQVFTGNGTQEIYTLANSVDNEHQLFVTVGGVPQTPGAIYSYTASGTTLTFNEAPNANDRIVVRYQIYRVRTT
jgi:hypothetical protein